MTKFVLAMMLAYSSLVFAIDERIQIKVFEIKDQGRLYHLIQLDIDPQAWDGLPLTDSEIQQRHAARNLLLKIQNFLRYRHQQAGKMMLRSPIETLILQSFERYPDPFGQLEWSDAGRGLHKVDEYFNHRCLILALVQGTEIDRIVGTVKFVLSDPQRLMAPLIENNRGFLPLPIALTGPFTNAVEYENLAVPSSYAKLVVPLLLSHAIGQRFFLLPEGTSIHLNAEDSLVAYHQTYGFEIVPNIYEDDMPAKRMATTVQTFLRQIRIILEAKLQHPQSLHPNRLKEVSWSTVIRKESSYNLCEIALNGTIPIKP